MSRKDLKAENYFCKDFIWDHLREEVESDTLIQFHLHPYSSKGTLNQNQDAQKNSDAWDKFHACHSSGKFFKGERILIAYVAFNKKLKWEILERRYLLKEFPELASCKDNTKVLEVGCGNGSTVLPLLCAHESIILYACDCSSEALERVKGIIGAADSISNKHRFHTFLWDFSTRFPSWLVCISCSERFVQKHQSAFPGAHSSYEMSALSPSCYNETKCCIGGVDFVTLIFTLSALPFDRMPAAIAQCFAVLKPGGLLLIRDYGLYDMTMLRFKPEQRVGYREYMRSEGTRSYFFCLDTVRNLMSAAGFLEKTKINGADISRHKKIFDEKISVLMALYMDVPLFCPVVYMLPSHCQAWNFTGTILALSDRTTTTPQEQALKVYRRRKYDAVAVKT